MQIKKIETKKEESKAAVKTDVKAGLSSLRPIAMCG